MMENRQPGIGTANWYLVCDKKTPNEEMKTKCDAIQSEPDEKDDEVFSSFE